MRSRNHRVRAIERSVTQRPRRNSLDVQENRMAQGFLSCRVSHAQREPCIAFVVMHALGLNAPRERRRDFHRPNFFSQDALASVREGRSREQNTRISDQVIRVAR
jgi:hypothetical protein